MLTYVSLPLYIMYGGNVVSDGSIQKVLSWRQLYIDKCMQIDATSAVEATLY